MKYVSNEKKLFITNIQEATLQECLDYCKNLSVIGLDTETTGDDPYKDRVLSLQLGDENEQYVIDTSTILLSSFKSLLEDKNKLFIIQNAQFDLRFLYHAGIYPENIYDTLLAEVIINGGYNDDLDEKDIKEASNPTIAEKAVVRKMGLDALADKYCGVTLDKSIRGNIHIEGLTERVIVYAGDDVKYLPVIRERQLQTIEKYKEKYGIDGKVVDLENEVVKVISRMVYNGVIIDADKYRSQVLPTVKKAVNDAIVDLDQHIHTDDKLRQFRTHQMDMFDSRLKTDINWNSPAQKLNILKQLYPNIKSTNKEVIKKEVDHPIGQTLLDFNKNKKLENAFGEKLLEKINPVTEKLHPSIWQILATGRISMSNPNLLQIPSKGDVGKTIRSCFITRKGYKMVGGDYSSFELAVIAEYSKDPLWVDTLNSGGNLHTVLCMETFDIPESKVNDPFPYNPDMTYRDVQKTIDFGLAYGMSEFKLSATIGISVEDAVKVINKFFSKVPKVKEFLNHLGMLGRKRGFIKVPNPYGRIRFFPKHNFIKQYPGYSDKYKFVWRGEMERAGKNTPIQGINAEVIKIALIKAQKAIDANHIPANILLSIYDELQTEVREDYAEMWREMLSNEMIEAAKVYVKNVPVKVDCAINDFWKK